MDIQIMPKPLSGRVAAIPSKSDAHRLLISAALCSEPVCVRNMPRSEDIDATLACLSALGASFEHAGTSTTVFPIRLKTGTAHILNCGESGSTVRFLLPVAAALGINATFTGKGRLPERPLSPICKALEDHGCTLSADKLPLSISGRLAPGRFELPGNVSSQFITGLLFALPLLQGDSEICLTTAVESAAYAEMTCRTLSRFGIEIEKKPNGYRVKGNQSYRPPARPASEGDWSNAAFWLAAGALGGPVSVSGLDACSIQADRAILSILDRMGIRIQITGTDITAYPSALGSARIDARECPDLVPIVSVLAAAASGQTQIIGASRLRLKESDRLHAMASGLSTLGANVTEHQDGLTITGGKPLSGGAVSGFSDHRIVMALAVASILCNDPVTITDAQAVSKSYPSFWEDFSQLGGKTYVL